MRRVGRLSLRRGIGLLLLCGKFGISYSKLFLHNLGNEFRYQVMIVRFFWHMLMMERVPPGMKRPLPDLSTVSALIREYWEKFAVLKKKHMGDREYWYLNLIGRDPKRNDKGELRFFLGCKTITSINLMFYIDMIFIGAIRALFEPYLKQAQEANVPAWLEATNTHARDVYAHFGFQVVEEVIIGKGRVARNGNLEAGGEGVVIYGMIVEPQAS
jgi:hypothetical protein